MLFCGVKESSRGIWEQRYLGFLFHSSTRVWESSIYLGERVLTWCNISPSTSAPLSDLKGPVGPPGLTRPKHKRTFTGFGAGDIKSVEGMFFPNPNHT